VWFAQQVQRRLRGPSMLVRYCDDFVVLFAYKGDADRVLTTLGKRLDKYRLQLHADKTRLLNLRHRPAHRSAEGGEPFATTINFSLVHPCPDTLAIGQSRRAETDGERPLCADSPSDRRAVPPYAALACAGPKPTVMVSY
jgi:hypothetical protein